MSTPNQPVVPQKQPTITSANLPPNQQPNPTPAVTKPTPYEEIVAKPLRAPNFIGLKAKNPNMALYWGNRAVGEKESGLRYDQLIAMGFRPAKPSEAVLPDGKDCPESMCRNDRIMYGDLICLIIPREDYVGATKWNAQSAMQRVRKLGQSPIGLKEGQESEGRVDKGSAIRNLVQGKAAQEGKIAAFIPNLAETDAKTADNGEGNFNLATK